MNYWQIEYKDGRIVNAFGGTLTDALRLERLAGWAVVKVRPALSCPSRRLGGRHLNDIVKACEALTEIKKGV